MDEQLQLLKKINRRTRFTQFLAWLALFFTAIGIAAGSKHWFRIDDKTKLALQQINEIKAQIPDFALQQKLSVLEQEINDNFKTNKAHLDKAMAELRTIQDSTQYIADSVYIQAEELTKQKPDVNIQTPTLKDWSLGEVHFLLQTAVQQFELKKDKNSSVVSLKLADNLLLERGELELLPVRKKISEDIALINQYAAVDVSGISQKIDELLIALKPTDIKSLKTLENVEPVAENKVSEENNGSTTEDNETLVNRVKKTINDAVIIRKLDKPLQEDLDSDSKERLFQLFSLRFETLKIMLLQEDNVNYQKQLDTIKPLIISYYPEKDREFFIEQLKKLKQVNLSPELPKVSGSLELLEKIMTDKNIMNTADQNKVELK